MLLSWRVENVVVVELELLKPAHYKFWSNFEFDRNIVSGTGARTKHPESLSASVFYQTLMASFIQGR